jgi:GT2 family glycosyltransferase
MIEHVRAWLDRVRRAIDGYVPSDPSPPPSSLADGARRGPIHYHLDSLEEQTVKSTGLLSLSGWACAEAGLLGIDLYLDDVFLKQIRRGGERGDVAAIFPEIADAGRSGFSEWLDLRGTQLGTHTLTLLIRDHAERSIRIDRTVDLTEAETLYQEYFANNLPTPDEEDALIERGAHAKASPFFEVWVVAGRDDAARLGDTIRSITAQAYPEWRLHVVAREPGVIDPSPGDGRVILSSMEDLRRRPAEASPTFLVLLVPGDLLAPAALSRAAVYLGDHPDTTLLYSDHDRVRPGGLHCRPSFTPDWSPDYLLAKNYVGGVFFFRPTPDSLRLCGEAVESGSPAWRFDLLLGLTDAGAVIAHLSEVLWSEAEDRGEPDFAADTTAVEAALRRRGWRADVVETDTPGIRRVRWSLARRPKVSIIIPTTGNPALLRPCVTSLLEHTRYPSYELLFIDNGRGRYPEGIAELRGRGLTVIERNEPFNWAKLNNDGARAVDGELLLFLNDDIEATDGAWLDELVAQACREDVATVGALLLYPNGRIQHAGIFLVDHGGGGRHYLRGLDPDQPVYEDLHKVVREVVASTGACLMVRRELFERLGGFDEKFSIHGNDLDFCLRAREAGYRNLWTPYCRLVHHESISRGEGGITDDEQAVWQRWEKLLRDGDPYYNRNLTRRFHDCSLNLDLLKPRSGSVESEHRPSARASGVNVIGYIRAEMGVGEGTRALISACDAAGLAFDIYNYEYGNPSRMGDETWSHRITEHPRHPINVLYVNAELTASTRRRLDPALLEGRYTIGYWVWELPDFPDEWTEAFRLVDEVWVPSRFVQDAVSLKSPLPVVRVPHVVARRRLPYLERRYFPLPETKFLFLMMYDIHSVRERKNPGGAIAAFKQAFAPDDDGVGLVIKINNADPAELAAIAEEIAGHPNIHILARSLSRYELDSLISACDAFVSLHRSEGFGLVIAEAMALGKPVVATNWSGNTDFMREANSGCVDYRLVRLDRDYGPYKQGQQWADPDVEHAAWWMKRIHADAGMREALVRRAVSDIAELLSPRRVGAIVARRLASIEQFGMRR